MGALIRFLVSLAAHTAWRRMGQRGAVPPMRFKGKTTRLPMIAPWQMMAATWIISKLWSVFGHDVKHRLKTARHPAVNRVGDLLPTPPNQPNPATHHQAGQTSNTPPSPAPAAARPNPNYDTQLLDSDDPQAPLPKGSVLSSMRDSTA